MYAEMRWWICASLSMGIGCRRWGTRCLAAAEALSKLPSGSPSPQRSASFCQGTVKARIRPALRAGYTRWLRAW